MPGKARSLFDGVLAVVARVPPGRVVTYGQVARMAGYPGAARQVGWALHGLPDKSRTPWHRVINAAGEISSRGLGASEHEQRLRLEEEGVSFDARGRVDLERCRWNGRR